MKRGTTPTLKVQIDLDMDQIDHVDFLLKQEKNDRDTLQTVLKTYPSEDVEYNDGIFYVSYTEDDSRTFTHDTKVWLDVRPVLTNGKIVATELARVFIYPTLFKKNEVEQE